MGVESMEPSTFIKSDIINNSCVGIIRIRFEGYKSQHHKPGHPFVVTAKVVTNDYVKKYFT